MARIRSIKPGFNGSDDIVCLSIPCRLHFAMLWTYADDDGRGVDNPRLIKAAVWPQDDNIGIEQIEAWQDELHRNGRIIRYRDTEKRYFEIDKFTEHQHPTRKAKSNVPAPAGLEQCRSSVETLFEHNNSPQSLQTPSAVVVDGEGTGETRSALSSVDNPRSAMNPVTAIKDAMNGRAS